MLGVVMVPPISTPAVDVPAADVPADIEVVAVGGVSLTGAHIRS